MAYNARTTKVATGGETTLTIPFGYLLKSHIQVTVNGATLTQGTDYTFTSTSTLALATALTAGQVVSIQRYSGLAGLLARLTAPSALTAASLNADYSQLLYLLQEQGDGTTDLTSRSLVSAVPNGGLSVTASLNGRVVSINSDGTFGTSPKSDFQGPPGSIADLVGTRNAAANMAFSSAYLAVRTVGFNTSGDGGHAFYARVSAAPAGPGFRSTDRLLPDGTTSSANGGYFALKEVEPTIKQAGGPVAGADAMPFIRSLLTGGFTRIRVDKTNDTSDSASSFTASTTVQFPAEFHEFAGVGYNGRIEVPQDGSTLDSSVDYSAASVHKTLFRSNVGIDGKVLTATPAPITMWLHSTYFRANQARFGPTVYSVKAVEFAGTIKVSDVFLRGFGNGFCLVPDHLSTNFADLVSIGRVSAFQHMIYDQNTPSGAGDGWLVDLPWSGDGLDVYQILSSAMTDSTGAAARGRNLRKWYGNGGVIRSMIGGDIELKHSTAMHLIGGHHEDGIITFNNTSGSLQDTILYKRGTKDKDGNTQASFNVTPLQIVQEAQQTSVQSSVVDIRNVTFQYAPPAQFGAYPTGDGVTTFSMPDILLSGNGARPRFYATFQNLQRRMGSEASSANSQSFAVDFGPTEPDAQNLAHIATRRSAYDNGYWMIEGKLKGLENVQGIDDHTGDGLVTDHKWRVAADTSPTTYTYLVVAYYDRVRKLGRIGTKAQAYTVQYNGNAPSLIVSQEWRAAMMLRVYRASPGVTAGQYDAYVDIAKVSGQRLNDDGLQIGGTTWRSRTAAVPDAVNNAFDTGYKVEPGEFTATSDAYGHVTVWGRIAAAPTLGAWRRGDEALLVNPQTDGFDMLIGYRRITDCLSTSPSNTVTDWQPMIVKVTEPVATTAQLTSATATINTTLKRQGRQVLNTDTGLMLYANGSGATSTWKKVADGTVAHTPA